MYPTRSDLKLRVPYGDTLNLRANINVIPTGKNPLITQVTAQIRTYTDEWLADLDVLPDNDEVILRCMTLLPVGLHFLDIRIETVKPQTGESNVQHTEVIQLEVMPSVTRPWYQDPSGTDRRFVHG